MKSQDRLIWKAKEKRGVTIVLVTVMLTVLLGFVALAVDVGYVMVTKNEIQNIADSAALAATRQLGHDYEPMTYDQIAAYVCDSLCEQAITGVAQDAASKNRAAGINISVSPSDVIIGRWNPATKSLTATFDQPDAVRVIARRDSSANGPVATFFAKILGISTVNVSSKATAALTGESTAGPAGLPIPIGISQAWFGPNPKDFHFCNQPIRFYPTNDPSSCAGWHVYDRYNNAPDSLLRQTIDDIHNGSYQSPETIAGETQFEFTGGTMSVQTFAAMKSLFDERKVLNDGVLDKDSDSTTWTGSVPVYSSSDCSNPGGAITIVGFATVRIESVQDSPVHQIDGRVVCESVQFGRGGGKNYGTKGSIPGLVE
jgi:Flp pilus assembly protein TadG